MWEPEFLEHVIILIKYKRKIGDLLKMGVLDKFLSIMKLDDGDDEYDEDEFFDDDEYDDDYEEKPKRSLFHKNTKDNDKDFDEDDEDDYTAPVKSKSAFSNNKVTPMRQPSRRSSVNMEVCVIKPTSVEDSREITETLLSGRTVILNLEGLDLEIAEKTGASTATISRVNRSLNYGNDGYDMVFERIGLGEAKEEKAE